MARTLFHPLTATLILWGLLTVGIAAKAFFTPMAHSVFPVYHAIAQFHALGIEPTKYDHIAAIAHHGPIFGTLVAPFAYLPLAVAGPLWLFISVATLATALVALARAKSFDNPAAATLLLLVPFVGAGSFYNLQSNILFTGLLLWGTIAVLRERWWLAALCLAIPAVTKYYPVAMMLVFVGLHPRQLLPRQLVVLAGLAALPFVALGPTAAREAFGDLAHFIQTGERFAVPGWNNHDLGTLLSAWGYPIPPVAFVLLQLGIGLLVFVLAHRATMTSSRCDATLSAYSLTSIYMVLLGPASEHQTYLLASPTLALLLIDAFHAGSPIRRVTLVAAFTMAGPFCMELFGRPFRLWVTSMELAPMALVIAAYFLIRRPHVQTAPTLAHATPTTPSARAA